MHLASIANLLILVGLIAVMLSMGLSATFEEVIASARNLRLVVTGLLANFLLVPAFTIGLLRMYDADPIVSAGFLMLAVCPGAPVAPPFAAIARGDVPCAIGQMVILAGLSALLSPALLGVLLTRLLPAGDLHIDYLVIVRTLLVAQILPLAIGLAIHHGAPRLTGWMATPVRLIANLLLLGAVVLLLIGQYETLALIRLRGWFGMLILLATSLGIGWLCGGPEQATRRSLAVTTGARNAAVALVIVSSNFAGTPAVTAVIAYSLVSILGTLLCAFLFAAVPAARSAK